MSAGAQARAYSLLSARIFGLDPSPSETLDAGLEDQARALASDWHQRYFKGRVLAGNKSEMFMQSLDFPIRPVEQERYCEPASP